MRGAALLAIPVVALAMTGACLVSYQLGWAQRGDAIYSGMFNQTVGAMDALPVTRR